MIPVINVFDPEEAILEQERQPDLAWKISADRMAGKVDELEAVKQAARKRLDTESGVYNIYSESYGLKTLDLIGKEVIYAVSTLKRRITESLLKDDRITAVSDFTQELNGKKITLTFTVSSVYGDFDLIKKVKI